MQTTIPARSPLSRLLAATVSFALVFTQMAQSALAATTLLADVPIAAKVTAKPNIVYTLDDSGSMANNYLPDFTTSANEAINVSIRCSATGTSATVSGSGLTVVSVGDEVNIIGASQTNYNGFVAVVTKPTGTTFTYAVTCVPNQNATAAAGATIQVTRASAYCRAGAATATCASQALNLSQSVVTLTSLKRPGPNPPSSINGPVTATATYGPVALPNSNFNILSTLADGDTVLIQNSAALPIPATTSAPYYGLFTISNVVQTVVGTTGTITFDYPITAVGAPAASASQTPTTAAGGRQVVISAGTFAHPPMHAADFNRLAYNPAVVYTAPLKADGTPLTNAPYTDANGNYATTAFLWNSASVDRDPFGLYEPAANRMWTWGTRDTLGARVNVPLYCNSDWPILVNDSNWPVGPNGATVLDAGTSNGQYSPTTGGWCRINGTKYDASVASGAPAVDADYNYPWSPSSGVGNQFFYRNISVKTLWCDATSPYWPQTITATLTGCSDGSTPVGGTNTPQTCNTGTTTLACNGITADRTYQTTSLPIVACDSSATFCSPPGTGTAGECRSCACIADQSRTPYTCSITGASCGCVGPGCSPASAPAACPNVVTGATGCATGTPIYTYSYAPKSSATCTENSFDPILKTNTGPTLLADAGAPGTTGAPGTVCRHNNYTYTVGGTAGNTKYGYSPYTFPGEGAGTGLFNKSVTSGCPAVGTTVPIPRHYYVVNSVQFCDNRIVTANDQWRGFGTGTCQDKNDLQQFKEVKYGKFTRVDLFAGNTTPFPATGEFDAETTPYPTGREWLAGSPTPENSESVNYANWYAYYSTRLLAAKTTSAIAFSYLTTPAGQEAYRVGFHVLGDEPAALGAVGSPITFVNVNDWTASQRTDWYDALFGVAVPTERKTATISAMLRIGDLFDARPGKPGLDSDINPLPGTKTDPIALDNAGNQISCQNNYHILFTDGRTNQVAAPTTVGDKDETIPTSLASIVQTPPDQVLPNLSLGGAWPAPFKQGAPTVSDTLADVATYYWSQDLRPTLKDDVPSSSGKVTTVGVVGQGDLDWTKDVAFWQHLNFNAISFGSDGTLDAINQSGTLANIIAGTKSWPNLTQPNDPIFPRGNDKVRGTVAIDDLWRATLMSRGSFVYARSPIEVSYGLANILAGIQNQRKSRVGASFGGSVLNSSNNIIYEATIEPGWAGDLLKVQIDPTTGNEVKTWWQASSTLKDQIDPAIAGVDEPWMDEAHRRVVTLTGSTGPGVPFRRDSLTTTMRNSLAASATQQEKIIAYLRGGNTFTTGTVTTTIEGTNIGQFRKRFGPMGDISNAQPAIVQPGKRQVGAKWIPYRPYEEATDPGYPDFAESTKNRETRIVAPANDGMVHVFDAGPVNPVADGGGTEVFAFIPRALFRGVAGNVATEDVTALQALTYQDGGVPIYHHHMYVDSSPRVADVDFSNGAGTDWRTIVVGGLGKGGNSYYALDLTSGDAADESEAASKVLWEWSNPEVKYSYGRPVIVKVRDAAYAKGRWVVIVTGGYNNTSGRGKVFFLDAATGTLLSTVTTSAGSAATPSGLAQIHAFVKNQNNQIAEQIYGGDLLGNLWRIDVSVPDSYKTASADLFATLTDPDGNPQPVTTAPQIEIDLNNGVDRYVFIGTGRLLDNSDLTSPSPPQTQTMYAIRDGTLSDVKPVADLPIDTRDALKPINANGIDAIAGGAPMGWYHDLPNEAGDSERIVVDVQADVNIAAYVGTLVQDDPCLISLPARFYARDYTTARSLLEDDGGSTIASVLLEYGAVGIQLVGRIQPDGTQTLGAILGKEDPKTGGIRAVNIRNPVTGPGSRLSWRILTSE